MIRTCQNCGEGFVTYRLNGTMCSDKCKLDWHNFRVTNKKQVSDVHLQPIKEYLYKIKRQNWLASDADVFQLIDLYDQINCRNVPGSSNPQKALNKMFFRLAKFYNTYKWRLDEDKLKTLDMAHEENKLKIINCIQCNVEFESERKDKRFCSGKCGAKWRYHNKTKKKIVVTTKKAKMIKQVHNFLYKIKDQKWMANEDDIFELVNLHREVIRVSANLSRADETQEDALNELFFELASWYKEAKRITKND